jgi:hypothetical protein
VATFIAYFSGEAEARNVLQQLGLETAVHSISFLNQSGFAEEPYGSSESLLDSLGQYGFSGEQCAICLSALSAGKTAVILQGCDAADMLVALQHYGVGEYGMV